MPNLVTQKIFAVVSAFDEIERRPDVSRLCGWLALALLTASFAPDLILVMDFSRPYQVAQFSQDEYWFMEAFLRLQNAILTGDWHAIRNFGSPFAYGFPFWLSFALISLPLHAHAMLMALFLRLASMAMKYAAFYIVYRRVLALTQKPLVSFLVLALVLGVPGFVFDGKIIGPEYFILLLVAISWSALFLPSLYARTGAAFAFALAVTIKFNIAPLGLMFLIALYACPLKQRVQLLKAWIIGAIVPLLLFFVPAQPFREILAVGTVHHIDYGFEYLFNWYSANSLEFDDMLTGGWGVDFLTWPLFLIVAGYVIYRVSALPKVKSRNSSLLSAPFIAGMFFTGVLACFLTSLTSLIHPWFVFAPFLLLMATGGILIGAGREGATVMLIFFLIYTACFGGRYVERWQHRIDKFETVAASESENAAVAAWIAGNCPKAREAVIDYNLIWPSVYDGRLEKMWTLIEVEDYRRAHQSAFGLLDKVDLLLLKANRVNAFMPTVGLVSSNPVRVPAGILGNFFPTTEPFYTWQHDFSQLSIFAREGVCKKEGP